MAALHELDLTCFNHGLQFLDTLQCLERRWLVTTMNADNLQCIELRWYHRLLLPLARFLSKLDTYLSPRGGQ